VAVIPESEWKFFEGTEQRIKHLARHQAENACALAAGSPLPWDPGELAERQSSILQELDYPARVEQALGMDPTPLEARHLDLHRRWALRALFETHPDLFPLVHDLQQTAASFRPVVSGREATRADLRRILRFEPDRDLRESAWMALVPLGEALEPDLTELIRRRELLARSVADTGFPALAFHFHEQERGNAVGLLDEFERFTRKAYDNTRAEIARTLGLHAVEPWDLDYGLTRLGELSSDLFPADRAAEAAVTQAKRWGFDADAISVVEADVPEGRLVQPVELPETVRVLHQAHTGFDAYEAMFRSVGEAVHHTCIRARRHFLEQESPALLAGTAAIFRAVLEDPAWLAEQTGASPAEVEIHVRVTRDRRIVELRRQAAHTAFENLVYAQSDLEPQRLYGDVMEHLMHDTRRAAVVWPAHPHLVPNPLSRFSSIIGAMIASVTLEHLGREFSEPWRAEEVGRWLSENYFEPGARVAWPEKVRAATGSEVSITALARDLGVSYDGPTLDDSEDVSDEAAADYFKDIDLSDLD
jgi:DNA-binding transcriptional ArsR family regulator